MQFRLLILFFVLPYCCLSQSISAFLVNSARRDKKIKVESETDILFEYTSVPNDTGKYKTTITCSGSVYSISDSVVYITTSTIHSYQHLPNGTSQSSTINYDDSLVVTAIPIRNITEVRFMKKSRAKINSLGIALSSLSASAVWVGAPAAGVQFNPLRFNLCRYAIVSLYGIAGFSAGIICTLASDYKYYSIIHEESKANKHNWYLKPGN